jgi:3-hydroxybutyryl-CoA dehydrogenase
MLAVPLAGLVTHPERFVIAHCLNPAYLIPRVEVSPARLRDDVERAAARLARLERGR